MSKGINCINDSVLAGFLGADGMSELKAKLIDMLVEEIRDQLHSSSRYIISPDDIATDLYNDVVENIIEEIKEEYKGKISEAVTKKMEGLGI